MERISLNSLSTKCVISGYVYNIKFQGQNTFKGLSILEREISLI